MLDLWQNDTAVTAAPTPNEGTDLPGWWDLHSHDVLFSLGAIAIVFLAVVLVLARWWLFELLITSLAAAVRASRRIRQATSFVRSRVSERLDE